METIKIRYCGGCNPDYDRTCLAKQIQETLGGIFRFVVGKNAPEADWTVVVHGCPTTCAETDPALAARTIHIRNPREAAAFIRRIRAGGPLPIDSASG